MIFNKILDFCKHYIPHTPKEAGVVGLATLTTLFYSTQMGIALYTSYIGYKQWTRISSEPQDRAVAEPCTFSAPLPNTLYEQREELRAEYLKIIRPKINRLGVEEIRMPSGESFGQYLLSPTESDTRKMPRPCRFFDILTSPYKPLGYWGLGNGFSRHSDILPSETTLQWVVAENDKVVGNHRLKQNPDEITRNFRSKFFYNENYLQNLLELNFYIFEQHQIFRENIFDKHGHVKQEGIEYFIRHHWDVKEGKKEDAPLLALIHAAFGDEDLCRAGPPGELKRYFQLIKIPNEPGLRDVIQLHQQFPHHEWKTIQALLRTFNDVTIVQNQLQNLVPGRQYYVREDAQIVAEDDSCLPYPIFIRFAECREANSHPYNYVVNGSGNTGDPYVVELFQID